MESLKNLVNLNSYSQESQEAPSSREPQGANEDIFPSSKKCEKCNGTGWALWTEDGKSYRMNCTYCSSERHKKAIKLTIPRRFIGVTTGEFVPRSPKQEIAYRQMFDETEDDLCWVKGYFIVGSYGSGKTHLLYHQYWKVGEDLGPQYTFLRSTKDLITELHNDEMGEARSPILSALENKEEALHLFWDDADKFKVTEFKLEALFDLVDKFYRHEHQMTVTSNLNLMELQEKLSPAICRRIDDMCSQVIL